MKYPPRRPGGWLEGACLKLPLTYLLMELLVYCGMRLLCRARLPLLNEICCMRFSNPTERHSSTNFFRRPEIFAHNFFPNTIRNPKQRTCQVSKM
jgi:hypothetical protein